MHLSQNLQSTSNAQQPGSQSKTDNYSDNNAILRDYFCRWHEITKQTQAIRSMEFKILSFQEQCTQRFLKRCLLGLHQRTLTTLRAKYLLAYSHNEEALISKSIRGLIGNAILNNKFRDKIIGMYCRYICRKYLGLFVEGVDKIRASREKKAQHARIIYTFNFLRKSHSHLRAQRKIIQSNELKQKINNNLAQLASISDQRQRPENICHSAGKHDVESITQKKNDFSSSGILPSESFRFQNRTLGSCTKLGESRANYSSGTERLLPKRKYNPIKQLPHLPIPRETGYVQPTPLLQLPSDSKLETHHQKAKGPLRINSVSEVSAGRNKKQIVAMLLGQMKYQEIKLLRDSTNLNSELLAYREKSITSLQQLIKLFK